jgi:tripartite-type tricarboxylate transporter receptor subunit TctC
MVKAGTPQAERQRLAKACHDAMRDPQVRTTWLAQGLEPGGSTPDEFAATLRADHDKWGPIIRKVGLKSNRWESL